MVEPATRDISGAIEMCDVVPFNTKSATGRMYDGMCMTYAANRPVKRFPTIPPIP